jgi:hypothetical protein
MSSAHPQAAVLPRAESFPSVMSHCTFSCRGRWEACMITATTSSAPGCRIRALNPLQQVKSLVVLTCGPGSRLGNYVDSPGPCNDFRLNNACKRLELFRRHSLAKISSQNMTIRASPFKRPMRTVPAVLICTDYYV